MSVEALERALEARLFRRLAEHEAAHAASALALGLDVAEAAATRHTFADLEQGDPTATLGLVVMGASPDDPESMRKLAIATLMAKLEEDAPGWPLRWPLPSSPDYGDEAGFCHAVKEAGVDRRGYRELLEQAYELWQSPLYERLHEAIADALEEHGHLDELALRQFKAISEGKQMEHLVKAATVTAVDRGEFTALAAAWTRDRVGDQIVRGAFARSIEHWRASGKFIPLHWDHKGEAANVIGRIDPMTMAETDEGLYVEGRLDLEDSAVAREAWRSMKANALSLSFGYIATKNRRRSDGVNELLELDLFEVSIVPHPANPDTRIISTKGFEDEYAVVRAEWHRTMAEVLRADPDAAESVEAKAARTAREFASVRPITISRFGCDGR